jgi:hypothetical protein
MNVRVIVPCRPVMPSLMFEGKVKSGEPEEQKIEVRSKLYSFV